MELYQLQYFIEVARNRNFTRAAKRLSLATPALSLQIQKLEKELGTRLLNRGQKETVLTPSGEILFERAQALLNMADAVKQSVAEVADLLAAKKSIALNQLEKDQFVVKRGESEQQTIEACRAAGFEPRIGCQCTEQETKIALVQAGLGVLLLPQLAASSLREGVVAVPIREPRLFREVGLIHRRGKELSAAAQALIDFIKKRPFPMPSVTQPQTPG